MDYLGEEGGLDVDVGDEYYENDDDDEDEDDGDIGVEV